MGWMSEGSRGYEFHISEALFFLMTECVRLHSNQMRRFQTLASLVNQRAAAFCELDAHDAPTLHEHLAAVPTKGDIRIYLMLPTTTADTLVAAKHHASKMLGRTLTVGDALSILLFDYVVERKVTKHFDRTRTGQ